MDPIEANMIAFRRFRDQAWQVDPAIGKIIDSAIVEATGFGASPSLDDILTKISNGLKTAADTAEISYKNYMDAQTQISYMQQAQRAGVPVDQYLQTVGTKNAVSAFISDPNSPIPSVMGVPIWVIVGGVLLVVLLKR